MKVEWIEKEGGRKREIRFQDEEKVKEFVKGLREGGAKNITIT
jgi:hypothetical protein